VVSVLMRCMTSRNKGRYFRQQTAKVMEEQMRLTLSPEKTHITHVDDGFDLLGFRIVRAP
jgi:RNA-directed DNA polymerase